MQDIYFEVPASTHETKVTIPHKEDFWTFKIVFVDSDYLDLKLVTVIAECKEDGKEEIQSLHMPIRKDGNNEFGFEFEATDDKRVKFLIYEEDSLRSINVMVY